MAESISHEEQTILKSTPEVELLESPPVQGEANEDGTGPLTGETLLDRYELRNVLGSGAWSTVYRGWHIRLKKDVAIKCLHPNLVSTLERLRRFELEAKTAGSLSHGGIVRVYDYGCKDNQPFTVMEFVDGPTLAEILKSGSELSLERCARLSRQICDALAYAHQRNVIHRDIKPENILVERSGQHNETAKLADFGIVKAVLPDDETQSDLTQTGEVIGTPHYMSPEQCSGKALDGRADIYSLGCLMYECLTGKHVFDGRTTFDCMRKHIEEQPPALFSQGLLSSEQTVFQDIVSCCLEKEPSNRPSAVQLSKLLDMFLRGQYSQITSQLKQIRSAERNPWHKRPKLLAAVLAASALCTGAGLYSALRFKPTAVEHTVVPNMVPGAHSASIPADDLRSCEAALNLAFAETQYGIDHFNGPGNASAARLQKELDRLRTLFDTGKGSFPASSPLQVVSVGHSVPLPGQSYPGTVNVIVTYQDAPVVLLLRSQATTKWNIEVKAGARIKEIITLCSSSKVQTISGVNADVPIKIVEEPGEFSRVDANPDYRDRARFLRYLSKVAALNVGCFQGKESTSPSESWYVGPESKEWRAQMIMSQLRPLHAEAMAPVRKKLIKWMSSNDVSITVASKDRVQKARLIPPEEPFEFLPGRLAENWRPSQAQTFKLSSSEAPLAVPDYTNPKIIDVGNSKFAMSALGVVKLTAGKQLFPVPGTNASFEPVDYDFVYDKSLNSFIVKDSKHLYRVNCETGKWSNPFTLTGWSDRRSQSPSQSALFLQGMAYSADSNSLGFLDAGEDSDSAEVARFFTQYTKDGKPLARVPLTCRVPLLPPGADGFTQAVYKYPYLVVVSAAPFESGSYYDRVGTYTMHQIDSRRYIWVMDDTGVVIMSAPLEERGANSESRP